MSQHCGVFKQSTGQAFYQRFVFQSVRGEQKAPATGKVWQSMWHHNMKTMNVCVNTLTARRGRQKVHTAGLNICKLLEPLREHLMPLPHAISFHRVSLISALYVLFLKVQHAILLGESRPTTQSPLTKPTRSAYCTSDKCKHSM